MHLLPFLLYLIVIIFCIQFTSFVIWLILCYVFSAFQSICNTYFRILNFLYSIFKLLHEELFFQLLFHRETSWFKIRFHSRISNGYRCNKSYAHSISLLYFFTVKNWSRYGSRIICVIIGISIRICTQKIYKPSWLVSIC